MNTNENNMVPFLFLIVLCALSGSVSHVLAVEGQDNPGTQTQKPQGDEINLPNGVIGVSLRVGAEHIGDPASLYVAHVHPEGPAQQAGLKRGDELVTVNGTAVTGKTYEQVIKMVRGEAGTAVKLGVKGEEGVREIAITRINGEKLYKSEMGPHGRPGR
ncbi:MAG TPA: PDZ domain-containing protein [Nitrospiraceae bacterium]|nr:PDZ domain-containing protein [Nitrospiraceae bacterium]